MLATPIRFVIGCIKFALIGLFVLIVLAWFGAAYAEVGTWTVKHETDPWTDQQDISAIVHVADGSVVLVGCRNGEVFVHVRINGFNFNRDDYRKVRWRVDDRLPINEIWSLSAESTGVYAHGPMALEFADMVSRATSRLVFMDTMGTRTFTVRGSAKAIGEVLAICGEK